MREDWKPRFAVPAAWLVSNGRPGAMIPLRRRTAGIPVALTLSLLVVRGGVSTAAFGDVYGGLPHGQGFHCSGGGVPVD